MSEVSSIRSGTKNPAWYFVIRAWNDYHSTAFEGWLLITWLWATNVNPLRLLLSNHVAPNRVLPFNAGETDDGSRWGKALLITGDLFNFVIATALSISRSWVEKYNVYKNYQKCDEAERVKCPHAFPLQIEAKLSRTIRQLFAKYSMFGAPSWWRQWSPQSESYPWISLAPARQFIQFMPKDDGRADVRARSLVQARAQSKVTTAPKHPRTDAIPPENHSLRSP